MKPLLKNECSIEIRKDAKTEKKERLHFDILDPV